MLLNCQGMCHYQSYKHEIAITNYQVHVHDDQHVDEILNCQMKLYPIGCIWKISNNYTFTNKYISSFPGRYWHPLHETIRLTVIFTRCQCTEACAYIPPYTKYLYASARGTQSAGKQPGWASFLPRIGMLLWPMCGIAQLVPICFGRMDRFRMFSTLVKAVGGKGCLQDSEVRVSLLYQHHEAIHT